MSGSFVGNGVVSDGRARARAGWRWLLRACVLLVVAGADCRTQSARLLSEAVLVDGRAPEVAVRVVGQAGPAAPGAVVTRAVLVQRPQPGGPDAVSVEWTPPAGATTVSFPDVQPDNPFGPAPYEFSGVAVSDSDDPLAPASLTVAYSAPAPPQPAGGPTFVDCFTAVTPAGNRYAATFEDSESGAAAIDGVVLGDAAAPARPAVADAAARSADGYRWWQAALTLAPASGVPLDQLLCQEWATFLQDPGFFLALRVPATPNAADGRSAPVPLVVPESAFAGPRVELRAVQQSPAVVFATALELRPEWLGVAGAILPAAAGERWVTIGVAAAPPAACPDGLAGDWEVYAELALDLGGADASCSECVLQQYLCYAGTTPPFFFDDPTQNLGVAAQAAIQRDGVTCAGPIPLRLAADPPAPPITLDGATWLQRLGSSGIMKAAHTLRGWLAADEQVDVTLTVASARRVPWRLYRDANLTDRITEPVAISGEAQFDFWAAAQMPLGFKGPESVVITAAPATPPGSEATAADHFWAGAWTPPPPAPALAVESGSLVSGSPVVAVGTLVNGAYRLVVVPNGAWVPGECYAGDVLGAVDVTVTGNTLPPTVVWATATPGSYDVLALAGECALPAASAPDAAALAASDARIVTGADCSPGAGVEVSEPPTPLRRHLRRR